MVKKTLLGILGISISSPTFAAFVDSALGNALANDASTVYYNSAVSSLMPNPQFVATMSSMDIGYLHDACTRYIPTHNGAFRSSGPYDEAPTNTNVEFAVKDNILLAIEAGYKFSKQITNVTYAHVFYRDLKVDYYTTSRAIGYTGGGRDFIGAKVTVNFV